MFGKISAHLGDVSAVVQADADHLGGTRDESRELSAFDGVTGPLSMRRMILPVRTRE